MASSAGKRHRERQKLEKAQAKAERKAARQAAQEEPVDLPLDRTEAELMEELGELQRAFEAGKLSEGEFADSRAQIQVQIEHLLR